MNKSIVRGMISGPQRRTDVGYDDDEAIIHRWKARYS